MPRKTLIQLRRDTSAIWAASNPVLASGEPGVETDTGKLKIGDGVSRWTDISYVVDPSVLSSTYLTKTNAAVTTAGTSYNVVRNITLSTVGPTGGSDGDVWLTYSA